MAISSITGAAVPPTSLQFTRTENSVEGSTPDGDGDSDDVNHNNTTSQSINTSQIYGTLGNNLNVIA